MPFVYIYRAEMHIKNSAPMRNYDAMYQRNSQTGAGIGWFMGMWFPIIAREEGASRLMAATLCARADKWMAEFLMRNQGQWESRHDRH